MTVQYHSMDVYKKEYAKLNTQQKVAVEAIDGPVLVIAGPGTGKTQLLSMRVANILKKTDTDPQNILCLTFTNEASLNMKQRLMQLVGNESKKIMVKTFHSFAVEIMNLYPDYFWNGAKLSTAPDTVQNEIIISILSSLSIDDPLAIKFAGNYTALSSVKDSLKLVKEAGLTPEKLRAIIELNLAYINQVESKIVDILGKPLSFKKISELQNKINKLPEQGIEHSMAPLTSLSFVIKSSLAFAISQDEKLSKTTNTGKWKRDLVQLNDEGLKGMHNERKRNQWWLSLADVYQLYRTHLHQRGYYDYADMLVEVISVIEQSPKLQTEIQDQFLFVLVDEFQDSNSAQMRLAHLVADHQSSPSKPNLMVVGDDDQSIYKFNGAELANMLTFQNNYPDTKLVVLRKNYRSNQAVLNFASKVIIQASDRLTLRDPSINKKLLAMKTIIPKSQLIHQVYLNQAHQNSSLTDEIATNWQNDKSEIAVLARNKNSLQQIAYALNKNQIPIDYNEQNNILDHQITKTVHKIASILVAINNGDVANVNFLISQLIKHPMWQIEPKLLWELAINSKHTDWLNLLAQSKEKKLIDISNWLLWLNTAVVVEPLIVIIEYILGLRASADFISPVKAWYIDKTNIDSDYLQGLTSLQLLLVTVDEFSRKPNATLDDFVTFIDLAIETNQIIANETPFLTGQKAVKLLTIHRAKGLEFDKVYIIDAIDNNWLPRTAKHRAPANLPLQPAFDDLDDYIRLMYVAVTRAKRDITICSYNFDNKNQPVLPTPIINELLPKSTINTPNQKIATNILEDFLVWPALSLKNEKQILAPRLQNFTLSVTALLDYIDIVNGGPNFFKERHLLKLPSAQSVNMAFGTAMHSTLEYAQILTNQNLFNLQKILNHYKQTLNLQSLTATDYGRFFEHGQKLLEKLFASDSFWLTKNSLPEQAISDVTLGHAKLFGKLDRIDIQDKILTIVDYKTGNPLSSFYTKDKSKAVKAWRYKTQLIFYCILAQNSSRFANFNQFIGKMIYLEASNPKDLVRELKPTDEDITRTQRLIETIWQNIMNLNFPDTSQYPKNYDGICEFEKALLG